jgi:hypothetical protein
MEKPTAMKNQRADKTPSDATAIQPGMKRLSPGLSASTCSNTSPSRELSIGRHVECETSSSGTASPEYKQQKMDARRYADPYV